MVTCTSEMYDEFKAHGFYGLDQIAASSFEPWKGPYSLPPIQSQGRIIASPVAFIGKGFWNSFLY